MATRVAIITGASRGIGAGIARRLAKDQYSLLINYRSNDQAAAQVKEDIQSTPGYQGEVLLNKGDVSDFEQAKRMVDQAMEKWGRIDVLVNNAGISRGGFLMMNKMENWWDVIHTNLGSVVNCTKAAVPVFVKQKYGKVINISSASGIKGTVGNSDYSSSKAAIIGFTKALAKELAGFGIIVNAIAPGFVDTDMVAQMNDRQKEGIKKMVPLKRMGKVEEVAEVAALLANDNANYILGQTIVIDGGITI